MTVAVQQWKPGQPEYPRSLAECAGGQPPTLHSIGEAAILQRSLLGLICSVQCPGSVVMRTFDAVRELRDAGVALAGGFHSPLEKECLEFLFRGQPPVVVIPARGLSRMRLPREWRGAIEAGRLLLASPFGEGVRGATEGRAAKRNDFIAALTRALLIPHASPGGKAESTARRALAHGRAVFTFSDDANAGLLAAGARAYAVDEVRSVLREGR